jgi:hypothetical protein
MGSTISDTAIGRLLESGPAVVAERIARGGGNTLWYVCESPSQLPAVVGRLSPGSAVHFLFGERFVHRVYSPEVRDGILRIVKEDREAVVGQLDVDGLTLDTEYIANAVELDEYVENFGSASRVFYCRYPGWESNGLDAVTVVLPDADGVLRKHPH